MIYAIVFSHITGGYQVHNQTCKHARSTDKQYCWIHEGDDMSQAGAVEACHDDEREKGGKSAKVKVCNCAK